MEETIKELKKRLQRKVPKLTKSQKMIANFILENPHNFAMSSVRELEKELHVSKSTIVRLAQLLGYSGFHEMKSVFLSGVRREISPIKRYKTYLSESSIEYDYLKLISQETISNIHTNLSLVDSEQYKKAIQLIEEARHVFTVGFGISTYFAEIASYLLNLVSIKANSMIYGGLTFAEQIVNFSQDDLVFAFSFPPYSTETIEAASYVNERDIKLVSVTDKVTNRIVQYSDVSLQVCVDSLSISNNFSTILILLLSIVTQIGQDFKKKTIETIESIEHIREVHLRKNVKKN